MKLSSALTSGVYAIGLFLTLFVSTSLAAGLPASIKCKPGDTPSNCLVDPCSVLPCTLKPWQKCYSNYCNKPVLFLNTVVSGPCTAVIVDTKTKKVVPTCPEPGPIKCPHSRVACLVDPCKDIEKKCIIDKGVVCVPNYCNGPVTYYGQVLKGAPCSPVLVNRNTLKVVSCKAPEPRFCPQFYQPVCGVNGKTYSNSCFLAQAGVKKAYDGECKCDSKYNPVCGSDKKTYGNACKAQKAGVTYTKGECAPKFCPELYQPVCGVNRKTYSNSCFLAQAGVKKAYDGECKCETTYNPVCGSNKKTYANACKARKAGVTYTKGACVVEPCTALCSPNVDCTKSTSPCKSNPKLRCELVTCAKQHLKPDGKPIVIRACTIVYFNKLTGYIDTSCTA